MGADTGMHPISRHWTALHSSLVQHARLCATADAYAFVVKANAISSQTKNLISTVYDKLASAALGLAERCHKELRQGI